MTLGDNSYEAGFLCNLNALIAFITSPGRADAAVVIRV